ncbi:hypothetical protein OG897_40235 [Streptomyces sp. NBC_00237]|uniref:hypothetical protein n=1 Tax=Streptomyces sp. NBC_00237 TaxID=2975687 RepID=UPI002252E00F|nr:hypothetical protein [Streptomyces sp. NBC_00237]MCX5207622.1 hypothetical protein [Streptomyces sp. NBC_00237]
MTLNSPPESFCSTVSALADATAETACTLADTVEVGGWPDNDQVGVHDALAAIDALVAALAQYDLEAVAILAPIATATEDMRRYLDAPKTDPAEPADDRNEERAVPAAPDPEHQFGGETPAVSETPESEPGAQTTVDPPALPVQRGVRRRRVGLGPGYGGIQVAQVPGSEGPRRAGLR